MIQTNEDKIAILSAELFFVLKGLKQGVIKSKAIIDTSDENAIEWPMMSLSEHIEVALARAGISMFELAKKK